MNRVKLAAMPDLMQVDRQDKTFYAADGASDAPRIRDKSGREVMLTRRQCVEGWFCETVVAAEVVLRRVGSWLCCKIRDTKLGRIWEEGI